MGFLALQPRCPSVLGLHIKPAGRQHGGCPFGTVARRRFGAGAVTGTSVGCLGLAELKDLGFALLQGCTGTPFPAVSPVA